MISLSPTCAHHAACAQSTVTRCVPVCYITQTDMTLFTLHYPIKVLQLRESELQVKYVLNKDKALLPKPESRGKSFDGIQLAVDGAERCDIPKYFACCTACFQAAQQAERQGAQPKLPKQVSTIDLEPQECRALGKTIEDKVILLST